MTRAADYQLKLQDLMHRQKGAIRNVYVNRCYFCHRPAEDSDRCICGEYVCHTCDPKPLTRHHFVEDHLPGAAFEEVAKNA